MVKWCGKFNWHGEVHELWTTTTNKTRARNLLVARLAKKLGRSRWSVSAHFNGQKDNFEIIKIKEGGVDGAS